MPQRVAALGLWCRRPTHRATNGKSCHRFARFLRANRWLRKGGDACWVLLPLVWLLIPALLDGRIAAMRDGGHYYIPLWNWMREEASATGAWPRWNPYENTGTSLAGDPTAALWYPGLWLFRLPLPFPVAYNAFLALHLVLAALGARRAAHHVLSAERVVDRTLAVRDMPVATRIAGAAYALGGAVLFCYSNPIYLIGAAWLPWGVAALVRWLLPFQVSDRASRGLPPVGLVVSLALMITGGDPQGAIHLLLMGTGAAWFGRRAENGGLRGFAKTIGGLAIAGGLAAAVSAPLVLPAIAALKNSERTGLAGRSDPFESNRYEFSVGPWRWLELVGPNIGGRMFPIHQRWMSALPAEGRVWTPSLYAGLIPLLLAVTAVRFAGKAGREGRADRAGGPMARGGVPGTGMATRWLRFTLIAAWLAACGHYGLGWLLRELRGAFDLPEFGQDLSGQFGGPYWLLTWVLPGYSLFRYPAKWTVVGTLALALLAARGWTLFARHGHRPELTRILRVFALLAIIGAVMVELLPRTETGRRWLARIGPDDWFGPFATDGMLWDLRMAWFSSFVGVALLAAARRALHGKCRLASRWAPTAIAVWTLVDLISGNRWMIGWLPSDQLLAARTPATAEAPESASSQPIPSADRWYRASSQGWWPEVWRGSSSLQRLEETMAWERASRFPKTNLLDRARVISIEDAWNAGEWRAMLATASELGLRRADGVAEPPAEFLRALSVRRVVQPAPSPSPLAIGFVELDAPLPRAWLVRNVEWWPASPTRVAGWRGALGAVDAANRRRLEILAPDGKLRDFAQSAVVELDAGESPPPLGSALADASASDDRVALEVRDEPDGRRTVVAGESPEPALLVLNDGFDPGWSATLMVTGRQDVPAPLRVHRVNRLMRGVVVPTGRWLVEFRFQSVEESWGIWLAASLGLPGLCLLAWRGRRFAGRGIRETI